MKIVKDPPGSFKTAVSVKEKPLRALVPQKSITPRKYVSKRMFDMMRLCFLSETPASGK